MAKAVSRWHIFPKDNTGNTISLLNTSEGAMGDSTDILQQMRELSIQAGNGVLTDSDRASISKKWIS